MKRQRPLLVVVAAAVLWAGLPALPVFADPPPPDSAEANGCGREVHVEVDRKACARTVAVSGQRDSYSSLAAISGDGEANGRAVAVSGTQEAWVYDCGFYACAGVSGGDDTSVSGGCGLGTCTAVSGLGDASVERCEAGDNITLPGAGCVAVAGTGDASFGTCEVVGVGCVSASVGGTASTGTCTEHLGVGCVEADQQGVRAADPGLENELALLAFVGETADRWIAHYLAFVDDPCQNPWPTVVPTTFFVDVVINFARPLACLKDDPPDATDGTSLVATRHVVYETNEPDGHHMTFEFVGHYLGDRVGGTYDCNKEVGTGEVCMLRPGPDTGQLPSQFVTEYVTQMWLPVWLPSGSVWTSATPSRLELLVLDDRLARCAGLTIFNGDPVSTSPPPYANRRTDTCLID